MKQEVTVDSLDLLYTDTPMKLLTTIAAVLLSISGFSQDYIEYKDFEFSHNGHELQIEQVVKMTERYNVGKRNLLKGQRQFAASNDRSKTIKQNAINITLGSLGVGYGVSAIGLPILFSYETDLALTFISAGAALTYGGIVYLKQVSSQDRFKQSADKSFRKVVEKLNKAIKAANQ